MLFSPSSGKDPRLDLLQKVSLFQDLNRKQLAIVNGLVHERAYLADEVIFDEGEAGQGLFIVLEGRVKAFRPDTPDMPPIFFGPGEFFGEIALLDDLPRSTQTRAVEDSIVLAFFRTEFFELLETNARIAAHISFQLARDMSRRIRQSISKP